MKTKTKLKTQKWLATVGIASGVLAGCGSPQATGLGSSSAATSTGSTSTAAQSCSTQVIDYGEKGTVTATGRGLYSDVKLVPGSTYPATAFYDGSATGGATAVKLSYWDGLKFTTEVVAGDMAYAAGSATWVRLGFFSDGRPMIAWATASTTVKVAMRSAALSSAGTWTAAVVDTVAGSANRALELAISPTDQVAISYLTNTASTGRERFIYCDAGCTSPLSFVAMTASTDTVDNTAIVAAQVGTGVAWCKTASSYIPAVVFGGNTSQVRYAACLGALSTCVTGTGWSVINVAAVANVNNKLVIDSSTTGDNAKILTKNAATLQLFQVTQACNVTPSSVTTNANTFGVANTGTAWMNLLRDSTGKLHVVANESTTNVRYYNSTTAVAATTNWNALTNIDTATLPAAGLGVGGAVLAESTSQLYATYGTAAAPFDLFLGVVNDTTVNSGAAGSLASQYLVDGSGGMQTLASNVRSTAVSATSAGRVAAAYIDLSVGANAGAKLKYSFRDSNSSSSAWSYVIVPGTGTPGYPGLAFDENDKPWISYWDASNFRFYVVTNSRSDGSGTWSRYQFPLLTMTAAPALPATNDTTVAMQTISGVKYPVVVVVNSSAGGTNGVKMARLNKATGVWTAVQTVDALSASFGSNLVSDFDATGIAIGYYDQTATKAKYSYVTDPTATPPTAYSVSAAGQGDGLSLRLNPSTGKPAMAYYDVTNNRVIAASCSNTPSGCLAGGWTPGFVDALAGVSGIATGATGSRQLLSADLTIDANGYSVVNYLTGIGALGNLYRAGNYTGAWVPSVLHSGPNAILSGSAAVNFAMPGFNVKSVRSSLGNLTSVYVGPGNWLYSASCGD